MKPKIKRDRPAIADNYGDRIKQPDDVSVCNKAESGQAPRFILRLKWLRDSKASIYIYVCLMSNNSMTLALCVYCLKAPLNLFYTCVVNLWLVLQYVLPIFTGFPKPQCANNVVSCPFESQGTNMAVYRSEPTI
jgi:hypothetical protein